MPESQHIEWKQSRKDEYLKWVCGFANAEGGRLFIGKNDKGNVVHVVDYERLLEEIPNKIRSLLGIMCKVNLLEENQSHYLEIIVPPYDVAVSLRGRYFYRTGSTNMELIGTALNEFLLKKSGLSWDEVLEPMASIEDIDLPSMEQYLEDAREYGRLPDVSGIGTMDILEKLRLAKNGKLKRAALVLFGQDPGAWYPNMFVKIGRFGSSASDLRFQEVIEGNLIQLLYQVLEVLGNKFLVKKIDFKGIYRVEKGEYRCLLYAKCCSMHSCTEVTWEPPFKSASLTIPLASGTKAAYPMT